ncbi:MAG: hypothetical protein ACLFQQ_13530 [Desulfococcaceae bacterium]
MRRFTSYGPVNERKHFILPRSELVESCADHLIDDPEEGGHFFTIWAPRQTGKTWLARRAKGAIESRHPGRFSVGLVSVQGVVMKPDEPEEAFLDRLPLLFWETFRIEMDSPPKSFEEFKNLFLREKGLFRKGLFRKPLILFIDEFDSLPRRVIDRLVTVFRDMYLKRDSYVLHGLALIGVRAVLGVESERGSPFNVQRSLHVPNFSREEVAELFRQYREESGQAVAAEVVERLYEVTRGQPGLVGWFGELLTETYNPGDGAAIDLGVWDDVFRLARVKEWNNTILNLIRKAKGEYRAHILELFTRSDIPFTIDAEWCGYAYLNGIIDVETVTDSRGKKTEICRFANPFIQHRLYNALAVEFSGEKSPVLVLEPLDELNDVFLESGVDIPALLERYKRYLARLRDARRDPWKGRPRRSYLHLSEAAGHFHLYSWLKQAVEEFCVVSPEFPTGNGRVDLHLDCGGPVGVVEVKSYESRPKLRKARVQAADYAEKLGLGSIALAVFVPVMDEAVLDQLTGESEIGGVRVAVVAIGWM